MLTPIRVCAAVIYLAVTTSYVLAQNSERKTLTGFKPSIDFLQVPNIEGARGLGTLGSCTGIAEAAVTAYDPDPDRVKPSVRLAELGQAIIDSRPDGKLFLREMNRAAQNVAYSTIPKAARTGDWLADWFVEELTRTRKPQVIGLDLTEKDGHAMVVYDAEKSVGKIILHVGDPNSPERDDLRLIYYPDLKTWRSEHFSQKAFPQGVKPCIIRWDEQTERPEAIPVKDQYRRLIRWVEAAGIDKSITSDRVINRESANMPLPALTPPTMIVQNYPGRVAKATAPSPGLEGAIWTDGERTFRFEPGGRFVVEPLSGRVTKAQWKWKVVGSIAEAVYESEGVFDNGAVQVPKTTTTKYTFSNIRDDRAKMTWDESVFIIDSTSTTPGKGEIRKQ